MLFELSFCIQAICPNCLYRAGSSIQVIDDIRISNDCFKNFTITWKHNNTRNKAPLFVVTLFQPNGIEDVKHTLNKYYMSSDLTPGNEYMITVVSCFTPIDCNTSLKASLNFTIPTPGSKF